MSIGSVLPKPKVWIGSLYADPVSLRKTIGADGK